ncbi:MAG: YciI family protein [Pseudomonadota bacterium]
MVVCQDGPEAPRLREELMGAHLAYIESVLPSVVLAGPCLGNAEGDPTQASLLIYEAPDAAQAEAMFKGDPYFQAGVWESWNIMPFLPVAGQLVGGKTW